MHKMATDPLQRNKSTILCNVVGKVRYVGWGCLRRMIHQLPHFTEINRGMRAITLLLLLLGLQNHYVLH